jgi:hypothetical protein
MESKAPSTAESFYAHALAVVRQIAPRQRNEFEDIVQQAAVELLARGQWPPAPEQVTLAVSRVAARWRRRKARRRRLRVRTSELLTPRHTRQPRLLRNLGLVCRGTGRRSQSALGRALKTVLPVLGRQASPEARALLKELTDAKKSVSELAEEARASEAAIRKRVQRLSTTLEHRLLELVRPHMRGRSWAGLARRMSRQSRVPGAGKVEPLHRAIVEELVRALERSSTRG